MIPLSDFAGVDLSQIKKVRIGVGGSDTAIAPATGKISRRFDADDAVRVMCGCRSSFGQGLDGRTQPNAFGCGTPVTRFA